MQKEYKKGKCYVQVRADICELATCIQYFQKIGLAVVTKSGLVAAIIRSYYAILQNNNMVRPITRLEEAIEILNKYTPTVSSNDVTKQMLDKSNAKLKIEEKHESPLVQRAAELFEKGLDTE